MKALTPRVYFRMIIKVARGRHCRRRVLFFAKLFGIKDGSLYVASTKFFHSATTTYRILVSLRQRGMDSR